MAETVTLVHEDVDTAVWGTRADGVSALERELARLRRVQSASAREHGHIIARASVLNLVVFATRELHARRAARTIADLSLSHPSRAIVLWADRSPTEGMETRLTMHCDLPRADAVHQVCYEQVLVRARGDSYERLASAVIPLLIPDLPAFLWWTDTPPFDGGHFRALLDLAHRLIIDSADFARPDEALPRIAEMRRRGRGRYAVTDFNWTRLTPWRDLVAMFFDVPVWRPFLDGITGMRMAFTVDADGRNIHPSQALLLLGWLGSRLRWKPAETLAQSEAGGLLFAMRRHDGELVRVRVRPRYERALSEGDLSGLRIQASKGGHDAEFIVRREAGVNEIETAVVMDGATVSRRTMPLATPTVVELLGEELTIVAGDRIYEEALAALVSLA